MLAVGANGEARLCARFNPPVAGPSESADRASAIPLRKTATCRCTEHDGGQSPHSRGSQSKSRGLELGRQIAVDLEADADLNEGWCRPSHCVPPSPGSRLLSTDGDPPPTIFAMRLRARVFSEIFRLCTTVIRDSYDGHKKTSARNRLCPSWKNQNNQGDARSHAG